MSEYTIAGTTTSPPNIKDRPYVAKAAKGTLPIKADISNFVFRVENQLSIGACVGNGVTSQLELIAKAAGVNEEYSRMALYNMTKAFSGRLGEEGLYVRNAYKVASHYGVCLEHEYPYDLGVDHLNPPPDVYAKAHRRRVTEYRAVVRPGVTDGSMSDILHRMKDCINEGLPVGIGLSITRSLMDVTGGWQTHKYDMVGPDVPSIGGHFLLVVGYDDLSRKFKCLNSWGSDYGDGGYVGIPYDEVGRTYFEGWMVREFNGMGVPEAVGVKKERITAYSITGRIVPEPEEVLTKVSIWMGRIKPGTTEFLLRQPLADNIMMNQTYYSGALDRWKTVQEGGIVPVVKDYLLTKNTPITMVSWSDVSALKGDRLFVAYGTSVATAKIFEVCTIPDAI